MKKHKKSEEIYIKNCNDFDKTCPVKIGDLIEYNYIYSNVENKTGIIVEIKNDINFYYMLKIIDDEKLETLPLSIISYKVL